MYVQGLQNKRSAARRAGQEIDTDGGGVETGKWVHTHTHKGWDGEEWERTYTNKWEGRQHAQKGEG